MCPRKANLEVLAKRSKVGMGTWWICVLLCAWWKLRILSIDSYHKALRIQSTPPTIYEHIGTDGIITTRVISSIRYDPLGNLLRIQPMAPIFQNPMHHAIIIHNIVTPSLSNVRMYLPCPLNWPWVTVGLLETKPFWDPKGEVEALNWPFTSDPPEMSLSDCLYWKSPRARDMFNPPTGE